jgi:predicted DNA-binding transcriptional regulator YafY
MATQLTLNPAIPVDEPINIGVRPRNGMHAMELVAEAAASHTDGIVQFVYTKADGTTSLRTMRHPGFKRSRLHNALLIAGWDVDRQAVRSFRAVRVSEVRLSA